MENAKKKAGRRPKSEGGALAKTLGFRLRPKMHDRLKASAVDEGRSLSEEVEARLARSFLLEDVERQRFGAPETAFLANLVATTATLIQLRSGKSFLSDPETFEAVKLAVGEIFASGRDIFEGVSNVPAVQRRFDRMIFDRIIDDVVGTAGAASVDLKDILGR